MIGCVVWHLHLLVGVCAQARHSLHMALEGGEILAGLQPPHLRCCGIRCGIRAVGGVAVAGAADQLGLCGPQCCPVMGLMGLTGVRVRGGGGTSRAQGTRPPGYGGVSHLHMCVPGARHEVLAHRLDAHDLGPVHLHRALVALCGVDLLLWWVGGLAGWWER
jgi:hypothetical protein